MVSGSADELDLINKVADIVVELDPDIIVGWDVEGSSWGYLNLRASHYSEFLECWIRNPHPSRFGSN